MKLISGKAEIVYLLSKVIEKYEQEHGVLITKNSNRKNYEPIAILLSDISNQLPHTSASLQHENYGIDYNPNKLDYPHRKYDITSNQVKDAFFHQIVSNPRAFMVDACYIYLYGKGRKGFEANPVDDNLIFKETIPPLSIAEVQSAENDHSKVEWLKKSNRFLTGVCCALMATALFLGYKWRNTVSRWEEVKSDMKITPYAPTKAEIDSIEGLWMSYIGSPQARLSDPNRYHMVAPNVVDIRYKNGYFTIERYGVNFNHLGYAQFESPWMVSLYTYVKNKNNQIEFPRHSLMVLDKDSRYKSIISASWNFDVGNKNSIIGIREVYIKLGKGGQIEEVMNTLENAACKCKILKWQKTDGSIQEFELKNQLLDSLPDPELKKLLNEKSILLRVPAEGVLIGDSLK